jgi:hypothetical protein
MQFPKYNGTMNYPTFHTYSVIKDQRDRPALQPLSTVAEHYKILTEKWIQGMPSTTLIQHNTQALLGYVVDATDWDAIYQKVMYFDQREATDHYDLAALTFLKKDDWEMRLVFGGNKNMESQLQQYMRDQVLTWCQNSKIRQIHNKAICVYCETILDLVMKKIDWDEIVAHLNG